MLRYVLWLTCLCFSPLVSSQDSAILEGVIRDSRTHDPLSGVRVCADTCEEPSYSREDGSFKIEISGLLEFVLLVNHSGYKALQFPVDPGVGKVTDLGVIYLEPLSLEEEWGVEESISETDFESDSDMGYLVLNAVQDLYEKRSAFNFSGAFYRMRGYDSKYREVLLNGISMEEMETGRASFSLWGGLNDMFRNRTFSKALQGTQESFGNIGGSTRFTLKPSANRPGLRVSSSVANRNYTGRVMASYNSGLLNDKWAFSFSASRRWAEEGYVEGTLYDAFSLFGAVEWTSIKGGEFMFSAIYAPQRRGLRSAITEEVARLAGHRYNPNWGYYNQEIRNSKVRKQQMPVFLFNYFKQTAKSSVSLALMYMTGFRSGSRLGYFNAPSPMPDYYRYLPSWQFNGSTVNFENARDVAQSFTENPQIRWEELVQVNTSGAEEGKAGYLLYDDIVSGSTGKFSLTLNKPLGQNGHLQAGVKATLEERSYYSRISDLLGASYHIDEDPFSETANDLENPIVKREGDIFGYHYRLRSYKGEGFLSYLRKFSRGEVSLAYRFNLFNSFREGIYKNERYPEDSMGKGDALNLAGHSFRLRSEYYLSGRHILSFSAGYLDRIPDLRSLYLNPRENNYTVIAPGHEHILSADLRYRMDLPDLKVRTCTYYTRFFNLNEINFYYYDGGVGNAFVQEWCSGLEKVHLGAEISMEYELKADVKFDFVLAHGLYSYTADPDVVLSFNTVNNETAINDDGSVDLGSSSLSGNRLAQGPQTAMAFGMEYRDPEYWWVGLTASYLDNNFLGISKVRRTSSFYLDADTGEEFSGIDQEISDRLLTQQKLKPIYFLDMTGGKSWLVNDIYISVFISVNNLFNSVNQTGGYEQNRTANYKDLYEDSLSGTPSFGPKHWYGRGRTYFLNLAVHL